MRFAVGCVDGVEPRGLARVQFDLQGVDDPPSDLVLDRDDVAQFAIEAVGSKMTAGFGVDQLRGDPDPIAGAADAPFEHRTDAELTGHHTDVDCLALVGEARLRAITSRPGEVGDHVSG